jgi:large subunit ribosomal protein L30
MKKLQVRQVRSGVGFPEDQRRTLLGLRLGKPGRKAELEDTPAVRGMLYKVRHLVVEVKE